MWLSIRLKQISRIQTSGSPLLRKPAQLLADSFYPWHGPLLHRLSAIRPCSLRPRRGENNRARLARLPPLAEARADLSGDWQAACGDDELLSARAANTSSGHKLDEGIFR